MHRLYSSIIVAVILLITFVAYRNIRTADFINFDDCDYVYKNSVVTNGLTSAGLRWAFDGSSVITTANWHPLTFLSLMTDVQIFGVRPGPIHIHNVILHAINGVLLYFFITGVLCALGIGGPKAILPREKIAVLLFTFLWILHPLRVESVAWISSRKDGICGFFFLLGLLSHLKAISVGLCPQEITRKSGTETILFGLSGLFFVCAFMGKPTAVVYPLVAAGLEFLIKGKVTWRRNEITVYLMIILMGVTLYVQGLAGATTEGIPLFIRIENAIAGIGHYVGKTVYPRDLAVFYPYRMPAPLERMIPGLLFCLGALYFMIEKGYVLVFGKRIGSETEKVEVRLVAFCMFWFFVTIAPVSGMIQVGLASCADRYTYLSSIPLSILLAYYFLKIKQKILRNILLVALAILVFGLSVLTSRQVSVWKNTLTVFKHAADVTERNALACCNTALAYMGNGDFERAFPYVLRSSEYQMLGANYQSIDGKWNDRLVGNLRIVYLKLQNPEVVYTNGVFLTTNKNVFEYEPLSTDPLFVDKCYALALCAYNSGLNSLAEKYFLKTLELQPERVLAWQFLAFFYTRQERFEDAENAFDQALKLLPDDRGFRAKKRQMLQRKRDVAETTTGEG